MKKLALLCVLFLLISASKGKAQSLLHCATDEAMNALMQKNQVARKAADKLRSYRSSKGFKTDSQKIANATYTIPIVFHILHTNGPENISDAQVHDAVRILNEDFRKKNADTTLIVPPYKAVSADSDVEFVLAAKDPLGNCTNGIVHHYDANTHSWDGDWADCIYTWDNSKYLNIYVVSAITFGAAGYTYLPGTASPQEDMIVILHGYTGSIGTSNTLKSRALTHEVGHWLGLEHVWGWSNNPGVACGDDGITDTPWTKGHQSCQLTSAVCTAGVIENVQNYMEYAYCSNMFTQDQALFMQTVLNDPWLDRKTLHTPANLAFTGVTNPMACIPQCDFKSVNNKYSVCAGGNLSFQDMSTNATVTSYSWSASGTASVVSPNTSVTAISFPAAGNYTVMLTVQNSAGSASSTKTVTALNSVSNYNTSYLESFEASASTPQFWSIVNADNGTTWARYTGAGSHGSNSFYIEGNANPAGQEDYLLSGIFNLPAAPGASLTIDVSYARANSAHNDVFKVQASKDCGGSWLDLYVPNMGSLAAATGGIFTGSLVPQQTQWKTVALHDHPNFIQIANSTAVMLRFYFKEDEASGFGNRLFIDRLNFSSPDVGLIENAVFNEVLVYPVPSNENVIVQFSCNSTSNATYRVMDVTGKVIDSGTWKHCVIGENVRQIELPQQSGLYFLELGFNGKTSVKKVVKE